VIVLRRRSLALHLPASLGKREQEEETHPGLTAYSGPSRENKLSFQQQKNIHSLLRNRLQHSKVKKPIYLCWNLRLLDNIPLDVADMFESVLEVDEDNDFVASIRSAVTDEEEDDDEAMTRTTTMTTTMTTTRSLVLSLMTEIKRE
jgi:hypothetical protein